MPENPVTRTLTNFLGESPFPYILFGGVLLLLGFGGILTTIGKEMKKEDEPARNVFRNTSSGLMVAMVMIAMGFVMLAIGMSKLI